MRSPTVRLASIARLLLIVVSSVGAGIILGWSVGVIVHPWLGAVAAVAFGGMLGYSLWQDLPRAQEPVRRDQVRQLISLGMCETDAADRDTGSPEFRAAKDAYDAAAALSTQAELHAAHDALRRHGY